jgi:hypothetical protein
MREHLTVEFVGHVRSRGSAKLRGGVNGHVGGRDVRLNCFNRLAMPWRTSTADLAPRV